MISFGNDRILERGTFSIYATQIRLPLVNHYRPKAKIGWLRGKLEMRMGIRLMQLGSANLGSRIGLAATYPIVGLGRVSAF